MSPTGVFTGPIPRVEASSTHRAFVRAATPSSILVPITEARKLVNRGETASSFYGPETTAITTTTVRDEYLQQITAEDELRIVSEFGADGHVPADRSVYEDQPRDEQLARINRYLESIIWLAEQFETETDLGGRSDGDGAADRESGTGVGSSSVAGVDRDGPAFVPLVKGLQAPEREVAYRVFEDVEAGQYSFYGVQYFSGGAGPTELVRDVRAVADEIDRPLFVIGLLSPTYLRRLPENVVAASGMNQWRSAVRPRRVEDDAEEMRHRWREFADEVREALR